MFTWAKIDAENNITALTKATIDFYRSGQTWVIVQSGLKWREGMIYDSITKRAIWNG